MERSGGTENTEVILIDVRWEKGSPGGEPNEHLLVFLLTDNGGSYYLYPDMQPHGAWNDPVYKGLSTSGYGYYGLRSGYNQNPIGNQGKPNDYGDFEAGSTSWPPYPGLSFRVQTLIHIAVILIFFPKVV